MRACLYFVKRREVFEKPGGGRIERIGHRFSVQLRSLESFENLFPIYTDQFRHGRPHFPPKAVAKTFAFLRHRVHHGFEAIWEINVLFGSNSESFHAVERA